MQEQQHSATAAAGPVARTAELRIPGVARPVESLSDFERLLKPRTSVPTQRYARFLALGDEALGSAGVTTRYAANHIKRLLEDLRGRSGRVDAALAGISLSFFSEDHDWRAIFKALNETSGNYSEYKLVALAGYRRYLLHCLDTLNQVSTDRLQSTLCGEIHAQEEEKTSLRKQPDSGYDSSRDSQEVIVRDLVRLPKGTTLPLRQGRDGPFELWLGKRRFRVETWAGAALVDDQGNGTPLHDGRNLVGRGLYNDVIVDAAYVDVSRRHLILDVKDGQPIAITDISSGGTFVSRALVGVTA